MDTDIRNEGALAYWNAFGIVLASLRRERSLSQEDLAELAGLHRTFVSRVERSVQAPSLLAIYALSTALGIFPSELLKRVESAMHPV
jgi:transcriptional regulator with XRE-family HTH domain